MGVECKASQSQTCEQHKVQIGRPPHPPDCCLLSSHTLCLGYGSRVMIRFVKRYSRDNVFELTIPSLTPQLAFMISLGFKARISSYSVILSIDIHATTA